MHHRLMTVEMGVISTVTWGGHRSGNVSQVLGFGFSGKESFVGWASGLLH